MADDDLTAALEKIAADARSLAQTRTPSWGTVPKIQRVIDGTERALAALRAVLELHQPQSETIYRACAEHALTRTAHDRERFSKMDACPGCVKTPHQVCAHCDCPNDEWPCPTYLAISREITGKGKSDERGS